jgi:uncharacterized membrane protein
MNGHDRAEAVLASASPRLMHARRGLNASLLQLACASVGLGLGLVLPRVSAGPTVEGGRLAGLLFSLGLGVMGVVTIVFSLLFSVVQWSATSFSPRLNLFRDDPLVWQTFAVTVFVFVFCVSAGLASGNAGQVSVLVPLTAVLAALTSFALIRALQSRAFLSMQLSRVLASVTARGRVVIDDVYRRPHTTASLPEVPSRRPDSQPRTVRWSGPSGVVEQLDLSRLVDLAAAADALVVFRVGVGDALHDGSHLADIHGGHLSETVVQAAVVRGAERSFHQDPMLALRLLADIALRALSPAVNDPATAVDTVDAIEGLLRPLATRDLEVADVVDRFGASRVRLVVPGWEDYLRTGVEDLIPTATAVPMVLLRLQRMMSNLATIAPPERLSVLAGLSASIQVRLAASTIDLG